MLSRPCSEASMTVAHGQNKPEINRPGMSHGLTPLNPTREQLVLNRPNVHLVTGKEGCQLSPCLNGSIRKATVDYQKVLETGYYVFWVILLFELFSQWSRSFSGQDWKYGQGSWQFCLFLKLRECFSFNLPTSSDPRFLEVLWLPCPFCRFQICRVEQIGASPSFKSEFVNPLWFLRKHS